MAKTKVTLIVDQLNTVKRVRIGEAEFPVTFGGPTIVNGMMGVNFAIEDCEIKTEKLVPEAASAETA